MANPWDIAEADTQAQATDPWSQAEAELATPKPVGTLRGLAAAGQRGLLMAEAVPEVVQLAGAAGLDKPTIRQQRKAFVSGMSDPRYGEDIIAASKINAAGLYEMDPQKLRRAERTSGPAGKLDMLMTPQRALQQSQAGSVAEIQERIQALPQSEAQQRMGAAKTTADKWAAWRKDPVELTASIVIESLPPSVAGAVVGSAAGPGGVAMGAGAASGLLTFSSELIGAGGQKFDLRDPDQVLAWINGKDFSRDVQMAAVKAGVVGQADAATAGVAGKFIEPALKQGLKRILIGSGKEIALQAAGGAGGEAAGQLASGQKLDPFDIAMEALAEVGTGPAEAFSNIREGRNSASGTTSVPQPATTPERPTETVPPPGAAMGAPAAPAASQARVEQEMAEIAAQGKAEPAAPDNTPATKADLAALANFIEKGGNNPFAPAPPSPQAVAPSYSAAQAGDTPTAQPMPASPVAQTGMAGAQAPIAQPQAVGDTLAVTGTKPAGELPPAGNPPEIINPKGEENPPTDVQQVKRGFVPPKFEIKKPIQGPTGAAIIGYEWRSKMGEKWSNREGGYVEGRVSDWDNSDTSKGTGRDIVHVFYVQHPDKSITIEGIRSAQNVLGISETRLMTIAKKEQAAQAYREQQAKAEAEIWDKAAKPTAAEAARDYRQRNHSPMRSFEENNALFYESVLFEKAGKFIRRPAKATEFMQSNGWKLIEKDPAKAPLTPAPESASLPPAAPGTITAGTGARPSQAQTGAPPADSSGTIAADQGANPRRRAANSPKSPGLTESDGLLFALAGGGIKLPAFIPDGIVVAQYRRLRKKWQNGKGFLSPKEKAQWNRIRALFPQNYEDLFGPDGETMRRAYDAAKKAGVAGELFTRVKRDDGRGFDLDAKLDQIEAATGRRYSAVELWAEIERLANVHQGGGAAAVKENAQLDVAGEQYETFQRDLSKPPTAAQEPLKAELLADGARFTMNGVKLRVTDVQVDADGNVTSVELEDGNRYGTQTVDGDTVLVVDKGSLKSGERGAGSGGTRFAVGDVLREEPGNPEMWNLTDEQVQGRIKELAVRADTLTDAERTELNDLTAEWRERNRKLTPARKSAELPREATPAEETSGVSNQAAKAADAGRQQPARQTRPEATDATRALLEHADYSDRESARIKGLQEAHSPSTSYDAQQAYETQLGGALRRAAEQMQSGASREQVLTSATQAAEAEMAYTRRTGAGKAREAAADRGTGSHSRLMQERRADGLAAAVDIIKGTFANYPDDGQGTLFAQGQRGGMTVAAATAEIKRLLGVSTLPRGIRVVSEPGATWGARIDNRNTITVNAAQVSGPARLQQVILEEGLHGVWDDPAVQKAWAQFKAAVTPAMAKPIYESRKRRGLPHDPNTIREEAAIDGLLNAKPGLLARLWEAIRAAFKRMFGIELPAGAREKLLKAAREFLKGQRNSQPGRRLVTQNAVVTAPGTSPAFAITAHHGTPHKVDRFSTDKIGTGEGAQVYGWGLYFAENPAVAEDYATSLGEKAKPQRLLLDGQEYGELSGSLNSDEETAWYELSGRAAGYNPDKIDVVQRLRSDLENTERYYADFQKRAQQDPVVMRELMKNQMHAENARLALKFIRRNAERMSVAKATPGGGNKYTVKLRPEPDEMLDWDKPLSKQSEKVKAMLRQWMRQAPSVATKENQDFFLKNHLQEAWLQGRTAAQIYGQLALKDGIYGRNDQEASKLLASMGIKGIRFLDQGSRSVPDVKRIEDNIRNAEEKRAEWQAGTANWAGSIGGTRNMPPEFVRNRIEDYTREIEALQQELAKAKAAPPATYNYVIFDGNDIRITHENGQEIGAEDAAKQPQFASGEFSFDAPESIGDQKARLAAEAKQKAAADKAADRRAFVQRGGDKLTGSDVDTNAEMFGAEVKVDKSGQSSLFATGDVNDLTAKRDAAADELRAAIRAHMEARDSKTPKAQAAAAKNAAAAKFQALEKQLRLFPDYVRDLINTASQAAQADDVRTLERVLKELDEAANERKAEATRLGIEARLKLARLNTEWRAAIADAQRTGDWQRVREINEEMTAILTEPPAGDQVNVDVARTADETRDLISATVDALNLALDAQSEHKARSEAVPADLSKLISDLKTRLALLKGWADDATEAAAAGARQGKLKLQSPEQRQRFMELESATDSSTKSWGEWWENIKLGLRHVASPVPEIPLFGEASERAATFLRGFRLFTTETNRVRKAAAERINTVLEPLAKLRTRDQSAALKLYNELGEQLRRKSGAGKDAEAKAIADRMAKIERTTLDKDPFNLFRRMVLYRDIYWRGSNLKTPDGKPITLPHNLELDEVMMQLRRITAAIDAHPDKAAIQEALKRHYQLTNDLQKSILDHGEIIPEALRNPLYFPHHMLDTWTGRIDKVKATTEEDFRRYLIAPMGSGKLVQTDYLKAMYVHTADVLAHNARVDLVQKYWQPYDISARLKDEHGEAWDKPWNLPPGYRLFAPFKKLPLRMDYILTREVLAEKLGVLFNDGDLKERAKESGLVLNIKPEDLHAAMVAGEKIKWALPVEIADALDGIAKREAAERNPGLGHTLGTPFRKGVNFWKKVKLFAHWNYIRYEYGNSLTDIVDKVMVADPKVATKLKQAAQEIWQAAQPGATPTEAWAAAAREGVFDTVTAAEVGELQRIPEFEAFLTRGEAGKLGVRKFAEATMRVSRFRESTFRYAKFLADVERIEAGKEPVYAGAFNRDIEALGNVGRGVPPAMTGKELTYAKAAEISLKTFGDYNSLGVAGQWLRTYAIPFWSWNDVNMRYHANQIRNIADGLVTGKEGARTTALKYAAVRVISTLVAVKLAQELWNQFGGVWAGLWDDDDDLEANLSEADRRRAHLIMGKDANGQTLVVYTPSAFNDVIEWGGGNNMQRLFAEYARGQITLGQFISDYAKQLPADFGNKLVQSAGPQLKAPYELASGKGVFPDVFDQRTIPASDRYWRLAGTLTDDRIVNQARTYLDRDYLGVPVNEQLQQVILQVRRRDPEQWAYYEAREDAADWKETKTGKRSDMGDYNAPEALALRNFRKAIYRGDVGSAEKLYLSLLKYGYTAERLDASIRNQEPLSDLNKQERAEYLATLQPRQRRELDLANQYYARFKALDRRERLLFPMKARKTEFPPRTNELRGIIEGQAK